MVGWSAHLPGDADHDRIRDWLRGHGDAPPHRFSRPYPAPNPGEIRLTPKTIATVDPCHLMAIQAADAFAREHGELWAEVREKTGVITAHAGVPRALADTVLRTHIDNVRGAVRESDSAATLSPLVEQVLAKVRERVPPCNEDTYAGTMTNVIGSRITSRCDLRGVSMALDAGDASGAAAVHTARRYLLTGELELALVLAVNGNSEPELAAILDRPCESLAEGAFLIGLATAERARAYGWPIRARLRFTARSESSTAPAPSTDRDYLAAADAVALIRAVESAERTTTLTLDSRVSVDVLPQRAEDGTPSSVLRYVPAVTEANAPTPHALSAAVPPGGIVLVDSVRTAQLLEDRLRGTTVLVAGIDDPEDPVVRERIDRARPALTVICAPGPAAEVVDDARLRTHELTFAVARLLWPRWSEDSSLAVLLPGQPAARPHPFAGLFTGFVKSLSWERPAASIFAVLTDAGPAAASRHWHPSGTSPKPVRSSAIVTAAATAKSSRPPRFPPIQACCRSPTIRCW